MAINQKDIKLLWGRSGNRCSKCKNHTAQLINELNDYMNSL